MCRCIEDSLVHLGSSVLNHRDGRDGTLTQYELSLFISLINVNHLHN